jgi:hypothetical protein
MSPPLPAMSLGDRLRAILQLERMRISRQAAHDAIDAMHPAHAARLARERGCDSSDQLLDELHELARFNPATVLEILALD